VTTRAKSARAVAVADVGKSPGGADGALDILSGYLFEIDWHEGTVVEVCYGFDATGDFEMDGDELSWIGGAFGRACMDPQDPTAEWWHDPDKLGSLGQGHEGIRGDRNQDSV